MNSVQNRQILNCFVCGSGHREKLIDLHDHWGSDVFDLSQCIDCGFTYLKDPPSLENLESYYQNESGHIMRNKPNYMIQLMKNFKFDLELSWLISSFPKSTHILDFGCGSGELINRLNKLGYKASAVDYYPAKNWPFDNIKYHQANLHGSKIDSLILQNVDLVIMRHVLEHLTDPQLVLRHLKLCGVKSLWIAVPNYPTFFSKAFGKYWGMYDPPRHISYFRAKDLENMLKKEGFAVQKITYSGFDELFTSLHRYLKLKKPSTLLTYLFGPLSLASALLSAVFYFFHFKSVVEIYARNGDLVE